MCLDAAYLIGEAKARRRGLDVARRGVRATTPLPHSGAPAALRHCSGSTYKLHEPDSVICERSGSLPARLQPGMWCVGGRRADPILSHRCDSGVTKRSTDCATWAAAILIARYTLVVMRGPQSCPHKFTVIISRPEMSNRKLSLVSQKKQRACTGSLEVDAPHLHGVRRVVGHHLGVAQQTLGSGFRVLAFAAQNTSESKGLISSCKTSRGNQS